MKSIPKETEPQIYEEKCFLDSEFVEIISGKLFEVEMKYPILGMKNAERQCFVRSEVYERLIEAALKLPDGYKFKIWDAWRPFALQQELYEKYMGDIVEQFCLDDCNEEKRDSIIRRFVSEPVNNRDVPPVHTTGGAVDLTIIDSQGKELEMGAEFDEFTDRTYTAFYENLNDRIIRDNRRMLYYVMNEAGFTNLPSEWWHYDYGDRFWAFYKKYPALYRGKFTMEEINAKGRK